jgi:hypothetical protein
MNNEMEKPASEQLNSARFNLILTHSLSLAAMFCIIFLLAKIFRLEQVVWLRFINYALFFPVAYASIKKAYHLNDKLNYFIGISIGFLTCFIGQMIYSLLFFIYLHFDTKLLAYIQAQLPSGLLNPELSIFFILASEGIAWSAITAFSLMQIFKWKRGRWVVHS